MKASSPTPVAQAPINQQAPGPCFNGGRWVYGAPDARSKHKTGRICLAEVCGIRVDLIDDETRAIGRLLAASYTAFDSSARQLGTDAVEMAERLGPDGLAHIAAELLKFRKLIGTDDKRGLAEMRESCDFMLFFLTGERG